MWMNIFQGKVNPTQCEALTMVCAQVTNSFIFLFRQITVDIYLNMYYVLFKGS